MSKSKDSGHKKTNLPKRMKYAKEQLEKRGLKVRVLDRTQLMFEFQGANINIFPYEGRYFGKKIKTGRGIANLLSIIDKNQN